MTYRPECKHFPCNYSWERKKCNNDCYMFDLDKIRIRKFDLNRKLGDYLSKIFSFAIEIIRHENRAIVSVRDLEFAVRQYPIPTLIFNTISIPELRKLAKSQGVNYISRTGLFVLKHYLKTEKWGELQF